MTKLHKFFLFLVVSFIGNASLQATYKLFITDATFDKYYEIDTKHKPQTVEEIKAIIEQQLGIPVNKQTLKFDGEELTNDSVKDKTLTKAHIILLHD